MAYRIFLISTLLIIIANGCTKGDDAEIHTALQEHFATFAKEAAARGVDVDIEKIDISGYIEEIQERGVLGQCKSYTDGSKSVIVDQNYWWRSTDMEREYIVFHELGHCILGRDHDNTSDQYGDCISIMQSGSDDCRGYYDNNNRQVLLDELFDK